MKYVKGLLFIFVPLIFLTLLITILNYFDIISSNLVGYFIILIPIIALFIGGVYVAKKSNKKGYIEGIKTSGIFVLLIILLAYLGLNHKIELKNIIYYLILTLSSVLGSVVGINKKKVK